MEYQQITKTKTTAGRKVRITAVIEEHLLKLTRIEKRIDDMLTETEERLGVRRNVPA